MSRSEEFSFSLEHAARQAIYNARVSATTERYYRQYVQQYEQMKRQGYDAYIPDEMMRLNSDLSIIRTFLETSPTEARSRSFEVGRYIRTLDSLAGSAAAQFERAERMRSDAKREQERQDQNMLMQAYYKQIGAIGPAVVHYAQDKLMNIRAKIESGSNISLGELQAQLANAIQEAELKASAWKKQTVESHKSNEIASKIDEVQDAIRSERIEDQEKAEQFIAHLQQLKASMADGQHSLESIESQIDEIESTVDDVLISEEIRRQTVVSIMKQLRSQEFTVRKPQFIDNAGESYVRITAQKPSGKRAVCKLDLHGKISYRFDNYEGMTCLRDIEKFNVDLERIYSVQLSDERVLWSNPDRLSKDVDNVPSSTSKTRQK